jgi:hypothetical protein
MKRLKRTSVTANVDYTIKIAIGVIAIACIAPLKAELGDSFDACKQKYGTPKIVKDHPEFEFKSYIFDNISGKTWVAFVNGKAAAIWYTKRAGDKFSDMEMQRLMDKNNIKGYKRTTYPNFNEVLFEAKPHQAYARYNPKTEEFGVFSEGYSKLAETIVKNIDTEVGEEKK